MTEGADCVDVYKSTQPATVRIERKLSKCETFFGGGQRGQALTTLVVINLDDNTVILLQIKAGGDDVGVDESVYPAT